MSSEPPAEPPSDPTNPWAAPGAPTPPPPYGAAPPPPPSYGAAPPPSPPSYGAAPPPAYGAASPPAYGAAPPPAYGAPHYGAAPPPVDAPVPKASNRTPWLVALGAFVVVVLIAVGVFVANSADDGDDTIVGSPSTTSDTSASGGSTGPGTIEVDGRGLPPMDDTTGDDPALGMPIPTISGATVGGAPLTIEPGRPQLIVVMAHWCPHCQAEIPRIVDWNDDGLIPSTVDVVGISTAVDETRGNYPPASWLERESWPFPVLADDASYTALDALGVTGFPTMIAVDEDGNVALRISGEAGQEQFEALIDAALTGAPDPDSDPDTDTDTTEPAATGSAPCPAVDGSSERRTSFDGTPQMCIDPSGSYTARMTTSMGSFDIELDPDAAPETVNNFVFLARYHFYEDVTFHRVIADFMIQGGDPEGTGMGGPGYEFGDELPGEGEYEQYSVAMANAGPDTNGSQFFIVSGEQGVGLPPQYSLFGKVTSGTEVIDAIQSVPTEVDDMPTTPVVIQTVEIVEGS